MPAAALAITRYCCKNQHLSNIECVNYKDGTAHRALLTEHNKQATYSVLVIFNLHSLLYVLIEIRTQHYFYTAQFNIQQFYQLTVQTQQQVTER